MGVKSYEDLCVFDVNFIEIVPLQDRSLSSAEVCAGSVVWPLSDKSFCLYIYCQLLDVLKSFSGFETAPERSILSPVRMVVCTGRIISTRSCQMHFAF